MKWLTEFICLPHQKDIALSHIEAVKTRTKKELMKNWEQILEGKVVSYKHCCNISVFLLNEFDVGG